MVNISINLTTFDDLLEGEKRDILIFQAGTHGLEDFECTHLDQQSISTLAPQTTIVYYGANRFW